MPAIKCKRLIACAPVRGYVNYQKTFKSLHGLPSSLASTRWRYIVSEQTILRLSKLEAQEADWL